jgi:hypothetical protein
MCAAPKRRRRSPKAHRARSAEHHPQRSRSWLALPGQELAKPSQRREYATSDGRFGPLQHLCHLGVFELGDESKQYGVTKLLRQPIYFRSDALGAFGAKQLVELFRIATIRD